MWPFAARYASVPEGRIHYIDEGPGEAEPVLLVHGTPTWSFEWRHVITALRTEYRVIAFDHLGFGHSDRPASANYSPEAHAARFRALAPLLLRDRPCHLVVHDFGGPIALDWALDHPEQLLSLTVVNSWMWPLDDDADMRRKARIAGGWIGRLLYRYANASLRWIMPSAYGDRGKLTPEIHRQYLERFPDADSRERVLFPLAQSLLGSSAYYASLWARRERLRRARVSVLWGEQDTAFPPKMLERWREAAPDAIVTTLASGHWPHEETPEQFVASLHDFLARPS